MKIFWCGKLMATATKCEYHLNNMTVRILWIFTSILTYFPWFEKRINLTFQFYLSNNNNIKRKRVNDLIVEGNDLIRFYFFFILTTFTTTQDVIKIYEFINLRNFRFGKSFNNCNFNISKTRNDMRKRVFFNENKSVVEFTCNNKCLYSTELQSHINLSGSNQQKMI